MAALEAAVSTTAAAPTSCRLHKTLAAAVAIYVEPFIFGRGFPFSHRGRIGLIMYEEASTVRTPDGCHKPHVETLLLVAN